MSLAAIKIDGQAAPAGAVAQSRTENGQSAALREQVVELIRRNL